MCLRIDTVPRSQLLERCLHAFHAVEVQGGDEVGLAAPAAPRNSTARLIAGLRPRFENEGRQYIRVQAAAEGGGWETGLGEKCFIRKSSRKKL